MAAPILSTPRLFLRIWKDKDFSDFAKMNADPRVMKYFPNVLSSKESNALALEAQKELQEQSYGLWAVEEKKSSSFIGFVGLKDRNFEAHFTPCTEIGWRLAFDFWGKGYAFEAASHVLSYGLKTVQLKEIISFTAAINLRSRKLMEKLNMTHHPKDDFYHPKLPRNHPLSFHVLYRKKQIFS